MPDHQKHRSASLGFWKRNPSRPGNLVRQEVRDEDGLLLRDYPDRQSLRKLPFDDDLRVRSLRDGRAIVATWERRQDPANGKFTRQPVLLALRRGEPGRVFPIELDDRDAYKFEYFEVSPDETLISIPGKGGRVAIVSVADGKLVEVLPGSEKNDVLNLPAWKANDELSLIVNREPKSRKGSDFQILLWTPRGQRLMGN